jgi:hypothetical protein
MITVEVDIRTNASRRQPELVVAAHRLVSRTAQAVAVRARFYAPEDTGKLRDRIQPRQTVQVSQHRVEAIVEADTFYAVWQHEGTGIYGPHGTRIVPRRAQFLRFYWKKVGAVVAYRSVRGTPGTKYLIKGVRDVCKDKFWDITYFTNF